MHCLLNITQISMYTKFLCKIANIFANQKIVFPISQKNPIPGSLKDKIYIRITINYACHDAKSILFSESS